MQKWDVMLIHTQLYCDHKIVIQISIQSLLNQQVFRHENYVCTYCTYTTKSLNLNFNTFTHYHINFLISHNTNILSPCQFISMESCQDLHELQSLFFILCMWYTHFMKCMHGQPCCWPTLGHPDPAWSPTHTIRIRAAAICYITEKLILCGVLPGGWMGTHTHYFRKEFAPTASQQAVLPPETT